MYTSAPSLLTLYDGWQGHQQSIAQTIARLTPEQLLWRPARSQRRERDRTGEMARRNVADDRAYLGRLDGRRSGADLSLHVSGENVLRLTPVDDLAYPRARPAPQRRNGHHARHAGYRSA